MNGIDVGMSWNAVKKVRMLGVSFRKMKVPTVKMETDTDWQRWIESDMLCVISV